MKKIFCTLLIVFLQIFSSCTGYIPPKYDYKAFKDNEKSYDLDIYWNYTKTGESVEIKGILKNVRYYNIRFFLMDVKVYDSMNIKIGEAYFDYRHDYIKPDEIVPFDIKIYLTSNTKPARLKFSYRYYFSEENKFPSDIVFWTFERQIR